jgi:WD40 repeat protein
LADVFISYAREDRELVVKLHRAFEEHSRETWVDWEGIEPSDEWLRSILEAIDAADAVLVVLSPDWLDSEVCRAEAEHAASVNKRLIPVVARDIEARRVDVPAAIASLNWVFAREGEDDFETAVAAIVRALDTDLELVRTHTLVLTRARAWEIASRRKSPLLRGAELGQAEAWLARAAAGVKPQPTELQVEFVEASRRASRRRVRVAVLLSVAVATVSLALAAAALVSRSRAIHESHVATARELTADSAAALSGDPELGLLLAQRALQTSANPQDELALVTALDNTAVRAIVHWGGNGGGVIAVSPSPRTTLFALAGQDGKIALWNPRTNHVTRTLRADGRGVDAVSFSPDGKLLASGGNDDTVSIWNVSTGRLTRSLRGHTGLIDALAWSGDGRYLISGAYDGSARIWNTSTGKQLGVLRDPGRARGEVTGVAFGPRNRFVVTANQTDGYTVVWGSGANGLAPVAMYRPSLESETARQLALSPDGKEIALAGADGKVRLWDWSSPAKPRTLPASTDPLIAVAFSRDGNLLAAGGSDGSARIWDTGSGRLVQSDPGDRGTVDGVAFSADGKWLVTAGADGTARLWAVRRAIGALISTRRSSGRLAELISGAVTSAGKVIVAADGEGTVHAWPIDGKSELWQQTVDRTPGCACVVSSDAKGSSLAVGVSEGVVILGTRHGARLALIRAPSPSIDAEIAANGSSVAAGGADDVVRVWSLPRGKQRYALKLRRPEGDPDSVAFSPDSRLLAVGLQSGHVLLLDASSGRRLGDLSGPAGPVLGLAISHDGSLIAAASADKRIWLWDLATRKLVRFFEGDTAPVASVAISPDDRFLAAASDDRTARIWDLDSGNEVRLLNGDSDWVSWVGFSPDGANVFTTSLDGELNTWDACSWCESIAALQAHAAPAIARCFTPDELSDYLHRQAAKNEPCAA